MKLLIGFNVAEIESLILGVWIKIVSITLYVVWKRKILRSMKGIGKLFALLVGGRVEYQNQTLIF